MQTAESEAVRHNPKPSISDILSGGEDKLCEQGKEPQNRGGGMKGKGELAT